MASRPTSKTCLRRFENELIGFLREYADEEGDQFLAQFSRILRSAGTKRPGRHEEFDDDEADDEAGMAWWKVLLIVAIALCILAALIGTGLWFFRKRRLERRAKIAAIAAGLSPTTASVPSKQS